MKIHTHPRYCVWTDDTLWSENARSSGLTYGIYDHKKECKRYLKGIIITSYDQAKKACNEWNKRLKNAYLF